jgi:putative membrane protein
VTRATVAGPAGPAGSRPALVAAVVLAGALVSPPMDGATADHLSLHMVQHVVLVGLVAPLLALGAPSPPRRLAALPTLAVALLVQATALLAWHVPAAFDAAERTAPLHAAEHLSLLAGSALLWWVAVRGAGPAGWGPGALALFLASFPMTALGFGMMLSRTTWYATYDDVADQQLAGVVMWSGGGLLALVGVVALGVAWVHHAAPDR